MIECKRCWWDTVETMIIVLLNEVMSKMVDGGWYGECHVYDVLSHDSSLVWSVIGQALWCVTKMFVWRERETTTWTCCDYGDDLSTLNTFRKNMDWMNLIRWCMNDEGLCMLWAWVTLFCVDVHWAGTRISILVNFFETFLRRVRKSQ